MTLPLQTELTRLRNQNQLIQDSLRQKQQYITQLEERLSHRAASNFVSRLQQQERPVTDYPEHEEILQQKSTLEGEITRLSGDFAVLKEKTASKDHKIEQLQNRLLEFQDNMKRLIQSSKQLNTFNEQLKRENEELNNRILELTENEQSTEDLQLAFQLVEEQQIDENDDLKEQIIELKDELLKAQQSAEFSLDQQKAAAQQAMLWQQNYQTLLSQFKSEKQLERSVKFDDIATVIQKNSAVDSVGSSKSADSLRPEVSLTKEPKNERESMVKEPHEQIIQSAESRVTRIVEKAKEDDEIEIDVRTTHNRPPTDLLSFKDLDSKLTTMIAQSREPVQDISVTGICRDLCGTNAVETEIELLQQSIGDMLRLKQQMCE